MYEWCKLVGGAYCGLGVGMGGRGVPLMIIGFSTNL